MNLIAQVARIAYEMGYESASDFLAIKLQFEESYSDYEVAIGITPHQNESWD
jgi:hypothetical protein